MQVSTAALTRDRASEAADILTRLYYLDDETVIPVDAGPRKADPRRARLIAELDEEVLLSIT